MNTAAEVTLEWADGEYLFALKFKQLEELERVCDAAIGVIGSRLLAGGFRAADIYHVIRLGLIGGGMAPTEAKQKVDTYVDGCVLNGTDDPASPVKTAQAIMEAVFFGLDEVSKDDTGKKPEAPSD